MKTTLIAVCLCAAAFAVRQESDVQQYSAEPEVLAYEPTQEEIEEYDFHPLILEALERQMSIE
jgi:hypothetical protein